ncbi:MAG TPA: SDR family NAD(P)-dependent oxidoreductase [Stellaceae bacterium]|nr:SDR family NAD(P)-dependent oxidoreductase [Stellaceae bacterium]
MIARAWITGASSGIGRALALALAARGAAVAASARRAGELEALAAEAARAGGPGRIAPFPVDVADTDAMAAAGAAIEAALGPLDLAVLNAGTYAPVDVRAFDAAAFRRAMEINYLGAVNGIAAVLPRFAARHAGQIAVVASVAGYRGLPEAAAYGPTKAALINLCEALKPDLDRLGVRISLVNPGFIKTPMTDRNTFPMPFLMPVEAAAQRILAGLEKGTFEITFPRRFTFLVKLARILPYALYFPLIRKATGR